MIRPTALSLLLSLTTASAEEVAERKAADLNAVEHYQIEADYYRLKAAALMQKYEPPANDDIAVRRVVLDALKIHEEAEAIHLRRLQKADSLDRQAIGVSELYLEYIRKEIAKLEREVNDAKALPA